MCFCCVSCTREAIKKTNIAWRLHENPFFEFGASFLRREERREKREEREERREKREERREKR